MSLPWIKLYASLPRHPKCFALDEATGRRRAWTHMVDLWTWAAEYAPTGDLSDLSDRAIAKAAGWSGSASKFVAALETAGFLDADRRLHDWDEHQAAHVELAEARVASPATSTDPADVAARRRAQAAERAARKRQRDAAAKSSVTERDASVTRNADSVTERDASRSVSVTERDESAPQRARTKKEREIKKETEKEEQTNPCVPAPAAGDVPSAKPDPTEAAITEVLTHWRDRVWVPTDGDPKVAIEGNKADGRRKLIRPLLGEGWTVERLKRVIDGAASDNWLMGRSPGAKPGGWTEVENVFRRSRLDAREKAASSPQRRNSNAPTPPGVFDALWGDPNGTEGVQP